MSHAQHRPGPVLSGRTAASALVSNVVIITSDRKGHSKIPVTGTRGGAGHMADFVADARQKVPACSSTLPVVVEKTAISIHIE